MSIKNDFWLKKLTVCENLLCLSQCFEFSDIAPPVSEAGGITREFQMSAFRQIVRYD